MSSIETTRIHNDNENLVLLFSKDRPDRLCSTLPYIPSGLYDIHLLDDSKHIQNQHANREYCKKYKLTYHGINEQKKIIKKNPLPNLQKFITNFGSGKWALGCNRNYAIIYALYLKAKKVIFIDDDIIAKPMLFKRFFEELENSPFVGSKITLMPDDSIVGHIYRAGGERLPHYVSGSFLGINLSSLNYYFLNVYNEDWIWLYLENNGQNVPVASSVCQLRFDPFKDWEVKLYFQEFGEMVLDGIFNSPIIGRESALIDPRYWKTVLKIRIQELDRIMTFQLPHRLQNKATIIIQYLYKYHENFEPASFSNLFVDYFSKLSYWRALLQMLRD